MNLEDLISTIEDSVSVVEAAEKLHVGRREIYRMLEKEGLVIVGEKKLKVVPR